MVDNKRSESNSRNVALAASLAALYAAGVIFFAPISFQAIQVRVADALLPLSIIFGPPAVAGLTLGALLGNYYASGFGAIDIVGGTVANLVATTLAWYVGRRRTSGAWLTAIVVEVLAVSGIVGSYLAGLTNTPLWLMFLQLAVGEAIAVGIGGYALLSAVGRVIGWPGPVSAEKPS